MERIPSWIRQNIPLRHIEQQLGTVVDVGGGANVRPKRSERLK